MKLLSKILTLTTSALLAAGFLAAAPTSIPISASAETIISQLGINIDGEAAGDSSGHSVSLSSDGTRVAIGAPDNGNTSGHVRVYDWDDSAWVQVGQDIDGEAAYIYSGSSVSLSKGGTRVAIGAYGVDDDSGHVRVYELIGGTWTQIGIDIDGEAAGDYSGSSVSLSSSDGSSDGTRVAIGAYENDGSFSNAGHVRVYDWKDSAWVQVGQDIDGEAANDYSGSSVSLSSDGTTVAIGAGSNDGGGVSNSGHVRVYELIGGTWTQKGIDIDGEAANDRSGDPVSISSDGTRVAIGAYANDGGGFSDSGHVRVYDWNDSAWVQVGQDIDGEAAGDYSGSSVSLSSDGTRVAIGAPANGSYSGHVRVYELIGGVWIQAGSDIDGEAANDWSGSSVS